MEQQTTISGLMAKRQDIMVETMVAIDKAIAFVEAIRIRLEDE